MFVTKKQYKLDQEQEFLLREKAFDRFHKLIDSLNTEYDKALELVEQYSKLIKSPTYKTFKVKIDYDGIVLVRGYTGKTGTYFGGGEFKSRDNFYVDDFEKQLKTELYNQTIKAKEKK